MGTDRQLSEKHKLSQGFTIVELLVVVVVIAILASITVVSYNGIVQRATQSTLQSALRQASDSIKIYRIDSGSYPGALSSLNIDQVLYGNSANRWAYTTSADSYYLSIGSTATLSTYNISNTTGAIQPGLASGHTTGMLAGSGGPVASFPTRSGYTDVSANTYAGDNTEVLIGSVPSGAWMMLVFSYTNAADPIPPSGWTQLVTRKTTGTMQTIIYGKIKQAGDANQQLFDAAGSGGEPTVNGVLLWGSNSAAVSAWTVGSYGDRLSNATSTTTVTPTVTTAVAKSLVLSISTERTITTETNYTSLVGVSPWIWIPQAGSSRMQTIAIGYEEKDSPGASQAMTVTYPNTQSTNGTAVQVIIPPSS